jgi:hypothetical protein
MFSQRIASLLLFIGSVVAMHVDPLQAQTVIDPDFSVVPIQCSPGYALQEVNGGNCQSVVPEQDFNIEPGIGWQFAPLNTNIRGESNGITGANTLFNPPSFAGLPFSFAGILQGPGSVIQQLIHGFLPRRYVLSFYLGSRYAGGSYDGNQKVVAMLDKQVVGVWSLTSFTPFTLRTVILNVPTAGAHLLKFIGVNTGDHTAFFSDVSIQAAAE